MPLNEKGHEVLDATPVARPVGWSRPESLQEQIRRFVRNELSQHAAAQGHETWEEAEDFEVGDDYDPRSPYELDDDQEAAPLPTPDRPGRPGRDSGPDGPVPVDDRDDVAASRGRPAPAGGRRREDVDDELGADDAADGPPDRAPRDRSPQEQTGGPARRRGDVVPRHGDESVPPRRRR